MKNTFDIAKENLLNPTGLTEDALFDVIGQIMTHNIDYSDLYFQTTRHESWVLEDGIIKEGSHSLDRGVGIRAISGEKTGFAYADQIDLASLTRAAATARAIAPFGHTAQIQKPLSRGQQHELYGFRDPILSMKDAEKIDLLRQIDAQARKEDPRITQVIVSLSGVYDVILVAASDGALAADVRPLSRLNVSVVVEHEGRRETGYTGGGGRYDYDYFIEQGRGLGYAKEAVRLALVNLEAQAAPAGAMSVVLGAGWPGVLLHEAIGHGLEGDFNRKQTSAFSGRIGERVAADECTVVDDGTLSNRRGSLNVDDEGTPTQHTVLIENGILKAYMQDKLNGRLMGGQSTGNGRRESYAHLPLPRMTNTYMLAGRHDPQEIIASVDKGIYAVNFGGGQVDITSGKFVFSTSEAYLIEKGKVTRPVKGATLIGNGPDVLTRVKMVGNDLALDEGVGTCGKDGQSVPVGVGQPTLRVDDLTVGGTA
jgi:TldD protein